MCHIRSLYYSECSSDCAFCNLTNVIFKNGQAEYEEEGTVIARLNEAVSTIVGGEDGPPEASENYVMKPCVEGMSSPLFEARTS